MSQYSSEANLSVSQKSEYLLCRCLIMADSVPTVDLHDRHKQPLALHENPEDGSPCSFYTEETEAQGMKLVMKS